VADGPTVRMLKRVSRNVHRRSGIPVRPRDDGGTTGKPSRGNRGQDGAVRPPRGEYLGVGKDYLPEVVERRYTPNWQYPHILSRPPVPGLAYSGSTATRYAQPSARPTPKGEIPGRVPIGTPRYFVDDEVRPAGRTTDEIIDMQRRLAVAGFLTEDVDLGAWDASTTAAYKRLLEYANAVGMDADTALYHYARNRVGTAEIGGGGGGGEDGGGGGGGGGGRGGGFRFNPETGQFEEVVDQGFVPPPLTIRTTNKDDLRRVFRAAVINSLGQGWSQAEINELVDAYNWMEIKRDRDTWEQETAIGRADFMGERTTGGEVVTETAVPDPETFIEEEARRRDPMGFKATQIAEDYAPAFFQALRGIGM
jgi:hypothetical protein